MANDNSKMLAVLAIAAILVIGAGAYVLMGGIQSAPQNVVVAPSSAHGIVTAYVTAPSKATGTVTVNVVP